MFTMSLNLAILPYLIIGFLGTFRHGADSLFCEFYNNSMCITSPQECTEKKECFPQETVNRPHCYALWTFDNITKESTVKFKGCLMDNHECYDKSTCVGKKSVRKKDLFYCCCKDDMCNQNFTVESQPVEQITDKPIVVVDEETKKENPSVWPWISSLLIPIFVFLLMLYALRWFLKRRKRRNHEEVVSMDSLQQASPEISFSEFEPLGRRTLGRFGSVWNARYRDNIVAVKVMPDTNKMAWEKEREVYKLAHMEHDNVLYFFGAKKRSVGTQQEFWLITAFHERGSLYDYLSENIISWRELCRIVDSIARGLMHLHSEIGDSNDNNYPYKPAIAHRDLKSENILLKDDMSACIADFRCALIFHPKKPCTPDMLLQLSTERYMAPEVLVNAIDLRRDSYLRADMYSCGLLLWELASRCTAHGNPVGEYLLPFEQEMGATPTLKEMQQRVARKKMRPFIMESWRNHPGLWHVCEMMEECWDPKPEARLTASCVFQRIASVSRPGFATPMRLQRKSTGGESSSSMESRL